MFYFVCRLVYYLFLILLIYIQGIQFMAKNTRIVLFCILKLYFSAPFFLDTYQTLQLVILFLTSLVGFFILIIRYIKKVSK